jgi:hypothetical protein
MRARLLLRVIGAFLAVLGVFLLVLSYYIISPILVPPYPVWLFDTFSVAAYSSLALLILGALLIVVSFLILGNKAIVV